MLEGHADPAVELHAVLHQLGAVLADEGLGGAGELGGVRVARRHRDGRGVADGVARLEPRLHVGEAVLQRLVRRQRPAERVAVEGPLDGHVERRLHRADRLGVGEHDGELQLMLDAGRGAADHADDRGRRHPDVVEGDDAKRRVRSTVCIGAIVMPAASPGTSTWVRPPSRAAGDEEVVGSAADSTGRFTPSSTTSSPSCARRGRCVRQARRSGAVPRSTTWRSTGRSGARRGPSAVVRAAALEGGGDDVGRDQRSGRGVATELVGDEREVDEAVAADAAAAVGLGHEQRRPAELGAAAPVLGLEADRVVAQPPQLADGRELARNRAVVSRKNSWSEVSSSSKRGHLR